jgi:hypothetical protein
MLDALWALEALEGTFKVSTERSNLLKVWAGLQRRNVDSKEGGNFIIGDGCIHF